MDDDREFYQEADGSWTVNLEPWTSKKVTGFKDAASAARAVDAINEAMRGYAYNAMMD